MSAGTAVTGRLRQTRRLRTGYEAGEVEAFVEAVEDALRSPTPRLSAADVAWQRFRRVRFRPGYDMDAVDDYLTEAEHLLCARESRPD